ncbi:sodium/hydrogen exchanger [Desulfurobacterium thermolithotrophum DSM 11699]|uniref:Sodium/hydrogen exchanger n=1 Tax=Desulfurobacterium thermolithotrophum (strain DSM 11699 / BSA) TaxID=868864 RepID=F0S420_DESTD|nr:cation:proton antiporter [Desulfurobacterium thermolithotrophum]ADY73592.1 sodium/hydrogen exchanger [Desulfurobacterium thermolithotrophum DSM 11699]
MEHFTFLFAVFVSILTLSYVISVKFKFPVIPVYIVAGILVSLLFHIHDIHIFKTLGVILLLFYIGLEFSIAELQRNFKSIISVGLVDLTFNLIPVFFIARLLGFDPFTAFVLAVILYPSSSAIVSKLLIDLRKLANPEVDTVLAILVFEDIAAAALLAFLVNFSNGAATTTETLGILAKIVLFLLVAVVFVMNAGKLVDFTFQKIGTSTEFVVLFVATLLFLIVEATIGFGLSESIGAFIAGMLFAESNYKEKIESVVIPYRDLFGALFFLTFGLSINLEKFSFSIILPLFVLLSVSFFTKILTGLVSVKFYGLGKRRGLSAGLMLLPRGEFSILVAATTPKLIPFTAIYVLISSILGSIVLKESPKILDFFFKKKVKKKSKLTRSQLLED